MSAEPAQAPAAVSVPRGRTAPGGAAAGGRPFPRRRNAAAMRRNQMDRKQQELDKIQPKSIVGILAKNNKIDNVKSIFADSRQMREHFIASKIMPNYTEEKLATKPVQKQTRSGQSTKIKVTVAIGNQNGLVGVASGRGADNPAAMQSALAKCTRKVVCVRSGYWGEENSTNKPHTVPFKVTGKCGSVRVRLLPAPPGRSIVANKNHTKILKLAGYEDVSVTSRGSTSTTENHVKALLNALEKTYSFYPPSDWNNNNQTRSIADDALILKSTAAVR